MISKVVFFRYMPLTELICKGHFMEELLKNGIKVEYLDISRLFYPNYEFTNEIKRDYVIKVNTYYDFKKYIKIQDKGITLFISIMTFEWRVYKLFRILTKNDCKLGVFARGMFPTPEVTRTTKLMKVFNRITLKKIDEILKNRITYYSKKYGLIKKYDIVFLTGKKAFSAIGVGFQFESEKSKIIEVNTADYDNYIECGNILPIFNSYAVFLDENLPSHPDTKLFNINTINANDYYSELNLFFDQLEFDFKVKVIIAAHPKSINYKISNPFNGREIFFNITNELIANSDFVIAHDSTSIGYAVLHKKPIISIISLKLKESMPENYKHTLSISKFLNSCLVCYDKYDKYAINLNVDDEKYNSYKYSYLTNINTQNLLTKNIFIEILKDLNIKTY